MQTKGLKLLVLGLDGATFDVIGPLLVRGRLPNLKGLIAEGASGELRSVIPPVTAPAWSSFMTGVNPGKHGIFQWRTYDPTNYSCLDERLITASDLVGRTFWDVVGAAGYKVGIVAVPVTYPPWEVNGVMLSGYPCPDTKRNFTFPPEYGEGLAESHNLSADHYLHASEEDILAAGLDLLERRTSLAIRMIEEEWLDLCVLVLGEIDRAQHDFWKYTDPTFPAYHSAPPRFRNAIAQHYEVCDQQLGRFLERIDEDTTVIIMSDHGAGPHPPKYFYTNSWLKELRLLTLEGEHPSSTDRWLQQLIGTIREVLPFEERLRRLLPAKVVQRVREISLGVSNVDWSRTKAYRFPMYHPAEGVEINLRGRQPKGIVEPGKEYEELRERIIQHLQEAVDPESGQSVALEVYRREELYSGPHAEIAPDIIFLTQEGFKAEGGMEESYCAPVPLHILEKNNGLHRMEGIFIAHGENIGRRVKVEGAQLVDLAPTILYALGMAIPEDMDGRILLEIFEPSFLASQKPRSSEALSRERRAAQGLTAEEEKEIKDKLRGLGYLS